MGINLISNGTDTGSGREMFPGTDSLLIQVTDLKKIA